MNSLYVSHPTNFQTYNHLEYRAEDKTLKSRLDPVLFILIVQIKIFDKRNFTILQKLFH